jgi:hypothetical protein
MSVFEAITIEVCGRIGYDVDGFFTKWMFFMPSAVWWALSGFAFFSKDMYVQLLASSYWVAVLFGTMMQYTIASLPPNPGCTTEPFALPHWPVLASSLYVVTMLGHRLYWRIPFSLFTVLRGILIGVCVPLVMVLSGNSTVAQALGSIGIGVGLALFNLTCIFVFWLERIDVLCSSKILRIWLGYRESITHCYAAQLDNKSPSEFDRAAEDEAITKQFLNPQPQQSLFKQIKSEYQIFTHKTSRLRNRLTTMHVAF